MITLPQRLDLSRLALRGSLFWLVAMVLAVNSYAQCSESGLPVATVGLASLPYANVSAVVRLFERYSSGATIGSAIATVGGTQIAITQTNHVAPTLPTSACREQLVNLGLLPVGNYDVTWTTTENITIPFPTTNTRVRTLTFSILPATAIPLASDFLLFLLAVSVATIGAWRLAR